MKTRTHSGLGRNSDNRLWCFLLMLMTLFVLSVTSADAQQSLQIPAPRLRPTPTPTPRSGSQVRTIPSVPIPRQAAPQVPSSPPAFSPQGAPTSSPATPSPSPRQAEPILPAIFRGCWQGEVRHLDSIERLPGGAKIGPWTPKTYRMCYRRVGSGPFELTLTEAGIAHNNKITNPEGRMDLLSTDGRSYASMRAFLHFDEYRAHATYFSGDTFPVDEVTKLDCEIEPDGMHVWGQVFGRRQGQPWFRAWWHALFVHVPDSPEVNVPAGGIPE